MVTVMFIKFMNPIQISLCLAFDGMVRFIFPILLQK